MLRRLLLLQFVLLLFPCSACAEHHLDDAITQDDTTTPEIVKDSPRIKKWYAGANVGIADLENFQFDDKPVRNYYNSIGYYSTGSSSWLCMQQGKIYAGYRMLDFMNVELGYSNSYERFSKTYTKGSGETVWSRRAIEVQALYVSALLKPFYETFVDGPYLKLGAHASHFKVKNTVDGSAANLNTIASGDSMPIDGTSGGVGALAGIGVDFRTGKIGAIRLEGSFYNRVGGTPYRMRSLTVGFHAKF